MASKAAAEFKNMFSNQLREVALEETEFVKEDESDASSGLRMASKAEALVRRLWAMALGYKERAKDSKGNEKITIHHPDKWAIGVIMDRVEGKATPAVLSAGKKATVADRVGKQASNFINKAADDSAS